MKKLLLTSRSWLDGNLPPSAFFRRAAGLLILFCLSLASLNAQQPGATTVTGSVTVRGRVVNEKGEPMAGATIRRKKGAGGTSTDSLGNFSLLVKTGDELAISYIGYAEIQYIIKDPSRSILVSLKALPGANMNDVIVVGYGTQKKANVLGAVSVIKAEDLVITKNENVVNMMTGKVPGVRIQQMSAEPGSFNTQYDIRGFGSNPLGNPTPPLIIIDGVPRGSGDLSRMDPNEIDNISVLKDASAAIYGVKAANGVIVVTTKRGGRTNGKFNITYSVNQSWQQFLDVPQGVDAAQYMQLYNESIKSNFGTNATTTAPAAFSDSLINLYKSGQLKSTNWMKAITRPLAPETQHNLSMSGGSDKVNYFFDLGYLTQGSLFKTNSINYNRWNFRSNVNVNFTKRLRGAANISGYSDLKNAPSQSVWVIFKYAENLLPTDPIYANDNPAYPHLEPDNDNPVVMTNSNLVGQNIFKNKNFQGQLSLEYDIPGITGLTAKAMYNYGYGNSDNTIVNKAFNLYTYDALTNSYPVTTAHSPSTVQRQYYTNTGTLMQLSLNYHHVFGDHNVTALGLYEENHSSGDNFQAQESFSLGIPYLFAGNAGDYNYLQASQDGNGLIDIVTKSYIGRFDYDYKGRYLAEFSFREDGSSKFPSTARWGFFPAGLLGWRISNEPFIQKLISPSVLTNLKFRASFGKLGDDQFNNFQWVSGYAYPGPGAVLNGSYISGVSSLGIPDLNLTWVTSKTFNIGADFDLYNGLLGGSVEYFNRTRTGLPSYPNAQIPGSSGLSVLEANLNADVTKGIEVTLTHHYKIHQVTYNISGNVGFSRIRRGFTEQTASNSAFGYYQGIQQLQLPNGNQIQQLQVNGAQSGRYSNIWWGYLYGGQFASYNQIYNYNVNTGGGNQAVLPGNYYYQDINHDGVIDGKDMVPLATRDLPMVNFGMTISAAWKNFDMAVLLQGATDFHVQYAEQLAQPLMYSKSALTEFMNRWHPADPNANMFDPNTVWVPGNYSTTGTPIADGSKAVQNATYLRVKTLEIGYTLPKKLLSGIGIQNVRVYVNSYNLATITGLKNSDPEHPGTVATGQDFNVSQAGYLYPMSRTFSCGAAVSF